MINAILDLFIGILIIGYFIYALISKNKKLLLSENLVLRILTSMFLIVFGLLFIAQGIILTFDFNYYFYLELNSRIIESVAIYSLLYLILNIVFNILRKEKIINRSNIVFFILLVFVSLMIVKVYSTPKIEIDSKTYDIHISDFLFSKTIKFDDIGLIQEDISMPLTTFDLFGLPTNDSFKGLFYTINKQWVRIYNKFPSECVITIEDKTKPYIIGFDSWDEADLFYNFMKEKIDEAYSIRQVQFEGDIDVIDYTIEDSDGHGSTAEESIEDFLRKHPEVSREDLNFDLSQFE